MYVVQSYALAVVLCIVTMLCWGSWANTMKLAPKGWRFELFYWDYTLGVLLLTLIFGLTLGSSGDAGRPFGPDLSQAAGSAVRSAMLGGAIFNAANILLVAAIEIAGMAVAFPVAIGLALVIGVVSNYIAAPVGNLGLLAIGVALVTVAIVLDAVAYRRLAASSANVTTKGLMLSVVSGILMGSFYRFVAASMYADSATPEPGKFGPYAAVFIFAVGIFLSSFIFNTLAMRKPFVGSPVGFGDYFKGSAGGHMTGLLGGLIWGVGMSLTLIASARAGFAISYGLGQGATMVAALWGVFIWKEFKSAPRGTSGLIAAMFGCFVAGLAAIVVARTL